MIVRDEAPNIERCLSSLYKFIDYYIICDTGSTDNTKEIIKNFFDSKNIKGEIIDHKWVDFGTNRSLALKECFGKTKWALVIDADDTIEGTLPVEKLEDHYDCYRVELQMGDMVWDRVQIFNLKNKEWRYEEPLHEYPHCDGGYTTGDLKGDFRWLARSEGNRLRSAGGEIEKYLKDYLLFKSYLNKDEKQPRKQFYAAQSAFDAKMYEVAETEYLKSAKIGNWEDEIFYSWYKIGICRQFTGKSTQLITEAYLKAYEVCPKRVEPLYKLSVYYRSIGQPQTAFIYAWAGINHTIPINSLFVETGPYLWGILDELSASSYYSCQPEIGIKSTQKLLKEKFLPDSERPRVESNLKSYLEKFPNISI